MVFSAIGYRFSALNYRAMSGVRQVCVWAALGSQAWPLLLPLQSTACGTVTPGTRLWSRSVCWHFFLLFSCRASGNVVAWLLNRFVGRAFRHDIEAAFSSAVLTPEVSSSNRLQCSTSSGAVSSAVFSIAPLPIADSTPTHKVSSAFVQPETPCVLLQQRLA